MFSDIVKTVKVQLYERVSSPLIGAFVISWCLWNYKFLLVLIDKSKIENKLLIIDYVIYPTWYTYVNLNLLGPLVTALFMIYLYPIPARKVFEYSRKQQVELKKIQQKIEDDTPMTLEEGRAIRQEALKLEIEFHSQLKKKDEEISDLKNIVVKLNEANSKSQISATDVGEKIPEDVNTIVKENTSTETVTPKDNSIINSTKDNSNEKPDTNDSTIIEPINNNEVSSVENENLGPSSRELFLGEFWKLDDESINAEANLLISQVSNHSITDASDILIILQRLFFFSKEGIIKISSGELKDIFQSALSSQTAKDLINFNKFNIISRAQSQNDPDNQDYKNVKEILYKLQEESYLNNRLKDVKETFSLLEKDQDAFFAKIYNDTKYETVPIFTFLDINEFAKILSNATPDTTLKMAEFLRVRYRAINIRDYLSQDAQPLFELYSSLKKTFDENIFDGSKRYCMKNLLESLESATQRLMSEESQ